MAPGEPEAVPADYQRELTARVRRREEARLRREWWRARDRIRAATADFRASGRFEPGVASAVRAIERQVGRLDERLR